MDDNVPILADHSETIGRHDEKISALESTNNELKNTVDSLSRDVEFLRDRVAAIPQEVGARLDAIAATQEKAAEEVADVKPVDALETEAKDAGGIAAPAKVTPENTREKRGPLSWFHRIFG
jgi:peptidoglycan hydrolase CwlO-like protein